jgi:hypothetical protein
MTVTAERELVVIGTDGSGETVAAVRALNAAGVRWQLDRCEFVIREED